MMFSGMARTERRNWYMTNDERIKKAGAEIEKGISLPKCRKCGCMKNTLDSIAAALVSDEGRGLRALSQTVENASKEMVPLEYDCLGCKHCYAAEAMNYLSEAFPSIDITNASCELETNKKEWPPVPGEYAVLCNDRSCPVAVTTLASPDLAGEISKLKPDGLCIVGKTETENIGIDKIIRNTITNTSIRYLVVAGKDPAGHLSGKTLMALHKNGIDNKMKVIDSPGRNPVLKNVSRVETESFRKQVQIIDMIGCENSKEIVIKIEELSEETAPACGCKECHEPAVSKTTGAPVIQAREPETFKMDKAGYFVVYPSRKKNMITVEHYNYGNKLLHIIEGKGAPAIYSTILGNGWVTEMSHAAYLGRELAKAESSIEHGFKYVQDKAPGKTEVR